ncbi:hypothetical protein BGZ49_002955 [Haplosporangium sp. Z 27]|nr:hypothetical protein BGZ49_002955 [Haplosporangium sp. Z 27]
MSLSEAQTNEEAEYVSLLHSHLQSGEFHFSYEYELTHSLQRQGELKDNSQPIWERADERFFWNYRLQLKLIDHTRRHKDQNLSGFIVPIINGFVQIKSTEIHTKPFTLALISRRSRHRAGTRYFSRGVDIDGNVSNFNETEQIVVIDHAAEGIASVASTNYTMLSHVQTRGSIPIFWTQINNIKYTPKLHIFDDPQTYGQTMPMSTGNRTKVGALHDLQNSIVRYVKNNFLDGARQDAYDLFLVYDVQEADTYPHIDNRPLYIKALPLVLVVGFAMLIACVIIPESLFSTHVILFMSFWIVIIVYISNFIVANGVYYVNWPKLVPLRYDLPLSHFPGFQSEANFGTAEVELGWKNE